MAATDSFIVSISTQNNPNPNPILKPMMWFSFIFLISLITFSFSLLKKKTKKKKKTRDASPVLELDGECENTHLSHSPILEMGSDGIKKKKKRAKKKKSEDGSVVDSSCPNGNLVCLYPFTSSSSATQRKIKHQYDELVKCHDAKGLTLPQVAQFATCLIEARNELKHKSEVIQRKFTITKALFLKADRSSIDRLRQQIYKLELEEKRLEEDTFVYNWLQQQLKISPAYKKMLEICACMELKAKSGELMENQDAESAEISFEELLAQEKKDSFWQKNGKLRSLSS